MTASQEGGFELVLQKRQYLYRGTRGELGQEEKIPLCAGGTHSRSLSFPSVLPANSDSVLPSILGQNASEPLPEFYQGLLMFPLTCLCSESRSCVLCLEYRTCTVNSHGMIEEGMLRVPVQMLGEARSCLSGVRGHVVSSRYLCPLGFPHVTSSDLEA